MPATVTTREVFPKDSTRESLDKAMQLRIQAGAIRSHVEDAMDGKVTFPRFHRHLYKEEEDEIGGQYEHHDQTAVYGRV
jgi:hypothetical protein